MADPEVGDTRPAVYGDLEVCLNDGVVALTSFRETLEVYHSCGRWTYFGDTANFCQWCGGRLDRGQSR